MKENGHRLERPGAGTARISSTWMSTEGLEEARTDLPAMTTRTLERQTDCKEVETAVEEEVQV